MDLRSQHYCSKVTHNVIVVNIKCSFLGTKLECEEFENDYFLEFISQPTKRIRTMSQKNQVEEYKSRVLELEKMISEKDEEIKQLKNKTSPMADADNISPKIDLVLDILQNVQLNSFDSRNNVSEFTAHRLSII